MSYLIKLTNGNILTQIPDTQLVTSFGGLQLIGKDFPGFGTSLNTDLVHMVENFASSTPPANPFVGQLWYDTVGNEINFWNGSVFKSISVITTSDIAPINPQEGDEWYNTISQQLFIWTGTQWLLIGPPAPLGGKEGFVVASIGNPPVYFLQLYANNVLLGVVSAVNMVNPGIAGFGNIRVGFNFPINPASAPAINPAGLFNISELTIGNGDQILINNDTNDIAQFIVNGNTAFLATSDPYGTGSSLIAASELAAGNINGAFFANVVDANIVTANVLIANTIVGIPAISVPGTNGEVLYSTGAGANGWAATSALVLSSIGVTANALTVTSNANVGGNIIITANASVGGNIIITANASVGGNIDISANSTIGGNSVTSFGTYTTDLYVSNSATVTGTLTSSSFLIANNLETENLQVFSAAEFNSGGSSSFTLPTTRGTFGQVMQSQGTGATTWANVSIAQGTFSLPGGTLGSGGQYIFNTGVAVTGTQVVSASVASGVINPILTYAVSTSGGSIQLVVSNTSSSTITWGILDYNYAIIGS